MIPHPPFRIGEASSFGWTRADWLDGFATEAWEQPNGIIRRVPKGFRFIVVQDDTGTRIKPVMVKASK